MPTQKTSTLLIPDEIIENLKSKNVWGSQVNRSVEKFEDYMKSFPNELEWKVQTPEAFNTALNLLRENNATAFEMNKLYFDDIINSLEAYTAMMLWRNAELIQDSIVALQAGRFVSCCVTARSLLEGVVQYLDFSRTSTATLEPVFSENFFDGLVVSTEFEQILVKTVFASRDPNVDAIFNPTNILTVINKRIAKIKGMKELPERYGNLCEVSHPNFLGLSTYMKSGKPSWVAGETNWKVSSSSGKSSIEALDHALWAISWAAATQVSSAELMMDTINRLKHKLTVTLN
jgi:hypothetical protein